MSRGRGALTPDPGRADQLGAVRLHLHRGYGWGLYGTLTAVVIVVAVLTIARYLGAREFIFAGVAVVGGVVVAGLLAVLTYSLVWPELTASSRGVRARTCFAPTVEADWEDVTIDADDQAAPGALRLELADTSVSINAASWVGFDRFVVLVASSAHTAARLTPSARLEVLRRFGGPR